MPIDRPVIQEEIDVREHHQAEPDFFSYFNFPSYEDIRRPVSALLAAVDTALAALNDEFDISSEESLVPISPPHSDAHEQVINDKNTVSNQSKVGKCCRRTRRSKTSKLVANSSISGAFSSSNDNKLNSGGDSSSDSDDAYSSVVGSISKLELHENTNNAKESEPDANVTNQLRVVSFDEKRGNSSDYFIVESEKETSDGWLVVIDQ